MLAVVRVPSLCSVGDDPFAVPTRDRCMEPTTAVKWRRYLKNGWQVTTAAPNKGLASQLKKIIMQSATKVNGACQHSLLCFVRCFGVSEVGSVILRKETGQIVALAGDFQANLLLLRHIS